jgi:hypothetical protein
LAIDSDHVILFKTKYYTEYKTTIYLVQLNPEKEMFTVKDAKSFATKDVHVVLDVKDRRNFAVVFMEKLLHVQMGRFEDRWIKLNPTVSTLNFR